MGSISNNTTVGIKINRMISESTRRDEIDMHAKNTTKNSSIIYPLKTALKGDNSGQ